MTSETLRHEYLLKAAEKSIETFSLRTSWETYSVIYGSKPERLHFNNNSDILGFTAEPDWDAMISVFVNEGEHGHPSEFHIKCQGIGRKGEEVSGVFRGGYFETESFPPYGVEADILRRCFGLDTFPPDIHPSEFMLRSWLYGIDNIAEKMNIKWDDIVSESPCITLFPEVLEIKSDISPSDVGVAMSYVGSTMKWDELKHQTATQKDRGYFSVNENIANWMDEGLFCRWLQDVLPTPYETINRISEKVSNDIVDALLESTDTYYRKLPEAAQYYFDIKENLDHSEGTSQSI